MKMRIIAKYIGLLLIVLGNINTSAALEMVCSHWQYDDSNGNVRFVYSTIAKCLFIVSSTDNPTYCVEQNMDIYVDSSGTPCGLGSEVDCSNAGFTEHVTDYWSTGAGAGSGCQLGGYAILPLTDTCIPFLLLAGIYGVIVYYRHKQRKIA
jgi:hypothetical protein